MTTSNTSAASLTRTEHPLTITQENRGLTLCLARNASELEDVQRLRHRVFAQEVGAKLNDSQTGLDQDEFDPFCDHLMVCDESTGSVVGTYRILPPHRRQQIGRLYSESEFDISRLVHLQPALIEVGRSCVHPEHRTGGAILLLWAGLAQYMRQGKYQHLIGCASVPLTDGGAQAAALRDQLQDRLCDPEYRVFPHVPFAHQHVARCANPTMPPLIKGYLRLGAQICGEPAWDPNFNSADFLVWLNLEKMQPSYARHFDLLATRGQNKTTVQAS